MRSEKLFTELLLSVADDKLVLGHRNSDWTGLAPILEEDIAFSSLAQDDIAHARALYELCSSVTSRPADALAFGRQTNEYRCATLVELPDEFDWARAICRQFLFDQFDTLRMQRLAESSHEPLADLARRLAAEVQVHVEHSASWLTRLGRGTDDSKQRMQAALDTLAPHAPMLLEPIEGQAELESAGLYPSTDTDMFECWAAAVTEAVGATELTLALKRPDPDTPGGRRGVHSEHLGPLLDEMCEVYRLEPSAAW